MLPTQSSGWLLEHHAQCPSPTQVSTHSPPRPPRRASLTLSDQQGHLEGQAHLSQHRYSWDLRSSLELCVWKPRKASCSSPGQPKRTKSRKGL